MLSVLFSSKLVRTIQLMQGEMENQDMLQPCLYTAKAQIIIVLLIPMFTHE